MPKLDGASPATDRGSRALALLGGLAAISATTLCFEVLLFRMMMFVAGRWYSNEVLGAAVMGVGVGAGWYGLRRRPGGRSAALEPIDGLVVRLAIGCAATALVLRYLPWVPVAREHLWMPAALAAVIPFLLTGYATAKVYSALPDHPGLVYAADLLGACVGSVLALGLLCVADVATSLLLTPFVALIALFFIGSRKRRQASARRIGAVGYAGLLAVGVLGDAVPVNADFLLRSNTLLGQKLSDRAPTARVTDSYRSAMSRVDLVSGDSPDFMKLFINGGTLAKVRRPLPPGAGMVYEDEVPFIAQQGGDDWLVLGAGGGAEVALALAAGARRVTAVEFDPGIIEAAHDVRDFSGDIYGDPRVELVVEDARFFVSRTPTARFDRIVSALTSTWANGGRGQSSVDRTPVYTQEAALEYWRLLKPGGRMVFFMEAKWMAARWMLTIADALREAEPPLSAANLDRHMNLYTAALETSSGKPLERAFVLVTKEPWSEPRWQLHDDRVRDRGWHRLRAGVSGLALYREHREQTGVTGPDLSSVTDDRPFLQALSPEPLFRSVAIATAGLLAAVFLALLGLRGARRRAPANGAARGWAAACAPFGFFFLIGAGFMGAEIALLRHVESLVGHPMVALALSLGLLLATAGAGALLAQKTPRPRIPALAVAAVAGVAAVLAVLEVSATGLRPLIAASVAPLATGIAMSCVLLAAAGVAMGIPFTAAVRLVADRPDHARTLPFLYAVNGLGGICGAALATPTHVVAGLRWVETGTVLVYVAALVLAFAARSTWQRPR